MIQKGYGSYRISKALGINRISAQNWISGYRAVGKDRFLDMDSAPKSYGFETRLSAVKDHPENHLSKPEVMKKYSIKNHKTLRKWILIYQQQGAEGLLDKKEEDQGKSQTLS